MRHVQLAGDKLFVDYSGKKVHIIDPDNACSRKASAKVGIERCGYVELGFQVPALGKRQRVREDRMRIPRE